MPQQTFEDVVIAEIKAEMARQDVTQAELARRLGWIQTSVSKRLTRKVPIRAHEIQEIANALGVTLNDLGWPFEVPRRAVVMSEKFELDLGLPPRRRASLCQDLALITPSC